MKSVTKIIWKNQTTSFWCGGTGPTEKTVLTLTRTGVQFKCSGKMDNGLLCECPISDVEESWRVKITHPDYQRAFEQVAQMAARVIDEKAHSLVLDGPIQSLVVYYEDGSKAKLVNVCGVLLDDDFLATHLSRFLPDRMSQTMFGEFYGAITNEQ